MHDTITLNPKPHLGQCFVEVEVLLVRDVGGAAQPERLVVIEQIPVPDRLLDTLRLGLVLFLLLLLLICAGVESWMQQSGGSRALKSPLKY